MVLIIDDCADIGRGIVLSLKMDDIDARCVETADAALAAMAQKRPHVIVLDDYMPGMDGLEFLALIRADPSYSTLPVIFHTAGDGTARRDAAIKLGISAWVRKDSTTWPQMLAHIHALYNARV